MTRCISLPSHPPATPITPAHFLNPVDWGGGGGGLWICLTFFFNCSVYLVFCCCCFFNVFLHLWTSVPKTKTRGRGEIEEGKRDDKNGGSWKPVPRSIVKLWTDVMKLSFSVAVALVRIKEEKRLATSFYIQILALFVCLERWGCLCVFVCYV